MATARARSHKHFQLDAAKLRRAQRMLRADTETEAIERALDIVIAEHERNRLTVRSQRPLRHKWHRYSGCVWNVGEVDATGAL